jgi:serine phosphatase RsbU (regulator of sigma subunit)
LDNETNRRVQNTKSFYLEYTSGMTRERLGREFYADSNRIKELYKEAVGDDIDPSTGNRVGIHIKWMRFINALGLRLNPTRRLFLGGSMIGFVLHFFSAGLFSTALLGASFASLFLIVILELLEKFDVKKEIDFARDIQLSLLPDPDVDADPIKIASFANTASEVGGDYVDIIQTETGTWVIIADVSGKGLQAALYMVRMQAMVHLLINKGIESPKELFLELNDFIKSGSGDKTFVTACAGFFPKGKDEFVFSRAGHNPPILFNNIKDTTINLRTSGLALGMASTIRLKKYLKDVTIDFKASDSIIFYTDGLTEARNFEGREFGVSRVESIMDIYGSLDANSIIEKIESSLEAFIGDEKQHDDITFTVIHKAESSVKPDPKTQAEEVAVLQESNSETNEHSEKE